MLFPAPANAQEAASGATTVNLLADPNLASWVQEFHARHRERAALENWHVFSLKNGILHSDGSLGNVGFLRYANQQFCNFELEAEFRVTAGTNNGICFRAPPYERDSKTPAHTGYELQIFLEKTKDPETSTGSLYSVIAAKAPIDLTPNVWHRARIRAVGPRIQAWIDDTLVQDYDQNSREDTRSRPACGYISVQDHGGDTDFRNMHLRVLP